jgi:hypothetical protein
MPDMANNGKILDNWIKDALQIGSQTGETGSVAKVLIAGMTFDAFDLRLFLQCMGYPPEPLDDRDASPMSDISDLQLLVYDADLPFVLKSVKHDEYQLLGCCFVDNIMFGESCRAAPRAKPGGCRVSVATGALAITGISSL